MPCLHPEISDSFFPFCLAKLKRNFFLVLERLFDSTRIWGISAWGQALQAVRLAGTIAVSQDLVCQELVPAAFCHYRAIHHHLEFDGL